MRVGFVLAALPTLWWPQMACGQDANVTACDTLLATRRIEAASGRSRTAAEEPGCRRIARGDVGSVEQRAMIGGAPYECLTVAGGSRCLWIVP